MPRAPGLAEERRDSSGDPAALLATGARRCGGGGRIERIAAEGEKRGVIRTHDVNSGRFEERELICRERDRRVRLGDRREDEHRIRSCGKVRIRDRTHSPIGVMIAVDLHGRPDPWHSATRDDRIDQVDPGVPVKYRQLTRDCIDRRHQHASIGPGLHRESRTDDRTTVTGSNRDRVESKPPNPSTSLLGRGDTVEKARKCVLEFEHIKYRADLCGLLFELLLEQRA